MIRRIMREEFDSVFQLLEISFPKDEYRTYEEQKALLDDPAYEIYVLPDSDGHALKAFIAVWEFDSFAFIDHFAVSPKCRGLGVGGEFLQETIRMLGKMVCLEVEPPDNETASRRIGFYERCKFFLNQYPYTLPPISAGRNPVPLLMMTYGRSISEVEFSKIKEELFTRVYRRS